MKIPAPTWSLLGWAAVLVVFVVGSRFLTVTPVLHRLGLGHRVSLLPSIHLSQLSEFSLVILVLGAEARHIGSATLESAAYAFAVLAVLSSNAILKAEALARRLGPVLTRLGLPDRAHGLDDGPGHTHGSRVMLLGCFTTGSSLIAEIERRQPGLLPDLTVVDFNPLVNERLRARGVRGVYGDVGKRETLVHAGVGAAEILVCTLPDSILVGISNAVLIRQLREINPGAVILATAEQFKEVAALYEAGADYVCLPRVAAAGEFLEALLAAGRHELPALKARREEELAGRSEVVP
jgi:voltage-gated potassium channel Kch